ncbi:sirohydrochlorin cobaltochelatase [uncultured Brachyspira sp.]|uniref:sirohydrochlorin cobaltochelatase n=1 Tax=uncultured Brachyspira sp. TaxID=221953 RepID=UPI00262F18A2|nr:sirohydrochlorin cobaltochelatase [uncultured Brachyspira sp.]
MSDKSIILLFHGANNYEETNKMYADIMKRFENEFKDFYITDAYSSSAIRKMMKESSDFPAVKDRLNELKDKNIREVYIAPIVLLQNKDYMRIFHTAVPFKNDYSVLKYGESLLSIPSDYDNMVSIIKDKFNDYDNYTYLFIGHGGKHHSNSAYGMLAYKLSLQNESYLSMTFSEGVSLDEIKDKLLKLNKKVLIIPILISKSFHYKKDISERIFNAIKELGLEAEVIDKTLGEWDSFINLCINKTKKLINEN